MNSLFSDLFRAVISLPFFLAAALLLLILFCCGFDSDLCRMCVPLVCTFPYAAAWLEESRSGFVRLALHRTSAFWSLITSTDTSLSRVIRPLAGSITSLSDTKIICTHLYERIYPYAA